MKICIIVFVWFSIESIGHYHWLQRSLGHIHGQGTKKDGSTKKRLQRSIWIFIAFITHGYSGLVYDYK